MKFKWLIDFSIAEFILNTELNSAQILFQCRNDRDCIFQKFPIKTNYGGGLVARSLFG